MRALTSLGVIFWVLAVLGGAAWGQAPSGMAIAHAPEEGFQACHGTSADQTLNCARQKCREAEDDTCLRVRWCYPAGHSGAMSYLVNRELTDVTFLCGAASEAALLRMLAAACAAEAKATECRLMVHWSPDGKETDRTDLLGKNTAP